MLPRGGLGMLKLFSRMPTGSTVAGLLVCAGSLVGCVTSSDNVAPPDFQTGPAAYGGSNATGSTSPAGGGASASKKVASHKDAYTVGSTDILEISVFKVPELSKSVQVADTGTINMPLLGEVPAAGKTAQEIEQDLTRKLGAKYLKNPQVTVFVKDHNSQSVTIEGSVMKPGVVPIRGKLSLVQLVATSGGLNNDLYDKNITVFRMINGERTSSVYDIDDIRAGKAADPELRSGDVVVVDSSTAKTALNMTLKVLAPAVSVGSAAAAIGD
jgi:polysaccharide export outer membrane protein